MCLCFHIAFGHRLGFPVFHGTTSDRTGAQSMPVGEPDWIDFLAPLKPETPWNPAVARRVTGW